MDSDWEYLDTIKYEGAGLAITAVIFFIVAVVALWGFSAW